ncbi:MAG TPA: hypothetical protein VH988_22305 [Thermoanaerobaculia bacterium]|jgi:hypothetical protein|nr:hypothetical protein [Thermoanaerobaculia bacterium]
MSLRCSAALLVAFLGTISPAPAQETPVPPAVRVLRTGGLKVESAALLVSGEQGGSIHVAVLPVIVPGAGGKVSMPVLVEIDGATLLKGNTGDLLRIEICLYALSAGGTADASNAGSIEASLLETVEVDLTRAGPAVERSGIRYSGELSLPPGEHSLRVLVRNALTGEVGLRILPLTVPDPGKDPLLLAPLFPTPTPDPWVAPSSAPGLGALADGGLPAALPVFGPGQEVRCELPVWRLPAAGELRIEVRRPDGGHVTELPARIEARRRLSEGLERLTVSFTAAGLEPNRYLLSAVVPGTEAPAWSALVVVLDVPEGAPKARCGPRCCMAAALRVPRRRTLQSPPHRPPAGWPPVRCATVTGTLWSFSPAATSPRPGVPWRRSKSPC